MTAAKPKQVVIDAFVLACASSPLRDVVGTDALRSVLDFEWRELTAEGSFDLQLVWETFESQPGFDPEIAAAPICRFKSWEGQLGLTIELPRALRNLGEAELRERAERCQVPAAQLQRVLRRADAHAQGSAADGGAGGSGGASGDDRGRRAGRVTGAGAKAKGSWRRQLSARRRPGLAAALAVVALATLAVAGYQAYEGLSSGAAWKPFAVAPIASELPVADAHRFGDQVQARLTDPDWVTLDRSIREDQLERALSALVPQGVTVLFLQDASGAVRAIAQRWGTPPRTRVILQ